MESNESNLKQIWNVLKTTFKNRKAHEVNENVKLSDDSIIDKS